MDAFRMLFVVCQLTKVQLSEDNPQIHLSVVTTTKQKLCCVWCVTE